ncbi:hypothetical protein SAMN05428944_0202 [Streptomyces sp. 1222.5]|uniref:hypothetical protein n=1 Tax=unclassified Streptomyces TaxID=2593676 RepID=UPI00089520F1|nr:MULTISPECIES: hypothetical protein [unclassified Streptomyces]PKW12520.1 hypothetical protein BX260_7891 [Streptomyces sp. 5112.2]SEB55058.1 hypothetical protein SAMN05428944_0202 [Streptomyces sp. 1222.5]
MALAKFTGSFHGTHGFPPDQNALMLATDDSHRATGGLVDLTPIPSDLTALYWVISEALLPGIDSGYFIHSPATAAEHFREYGPAPVDGEAIVFASDGGGHLFAISDSGHIWKSTTASWFDDFEVAASSLQEFLEHISQRITSRP